MAHLNKNRKAKKKKENINRKQQFMSQETAYG
jgi:hypothetical protein